MTGADVLLIGDEPHDHDVVRLMIQEVPAAVYLTHAQSHGKACVWCKVAGVDLTPLGGFYWQPSACADCGKVRLAYLRAYLAWRAHVLDCESCRTQWCPDGWSLALEHQVAHEATGKSGRVICACGCPLSRTSRRLRPYFERLFSTRYSHTGPCHRPGAPAAAGEPLADEVG